MIRNSIIGFLTLCLTASAWAQGISWRIEWPWGGEWSGSADPIKILTNPLSIVNPTGIPTTADFVEVVTRNPDDLFKLVKDPATIGDIAVATWISSSRNAVLAKGGSRIPDEIRSQLIAWYPAELLDSVRWSTEWNLVQNVPQVLQFTVDKNISAITFMNVVVFREPKGVQDVALWAHELYHVQQYSEWGLVDFARKWVDDWSLTGPVEGPAYDQENRVREAIESRGGPMTVALPTGFDCYTKANSIAYCDLYAAYGGPAVRFEVKGDAQATSNGTNSGRMRLIMLADGKPCNSGATVDRSIDNATRLQGVDYECIVNVPAGTFARVVLSAPNNKADATFTRATVTQLVAPVRTEGVCRSISASQARCELSAAPGAEVTFQVSGDAEATGNGTNSGSMRLVLSVDGVPCNARAQQTVGVDNGTRLNGEGYSCRVTVAGGTTKRVEISAPNDRAAAKFTTGNATVVAVPTRTAADCQSLSASAARCDLIVGGDLRDATFVVSADADATGNGTGSGSMQLNITVDGVPCNARAGVSVGVDNETRLNGDGYSCVITVAGGTTKRVEVSAPNDRATAQFTRVQATVTPGPKR